VKASEKVARELYAFLGVDEKFRPTVLAKKVNEARSVRSETFKSFSAHALSFLRRYSRTFVEKMFPMGGVVHRVYRTFNLTENKKYPPMDPAMRARLDAYYRDEIVELEKLIGRDLSAWKTRR
jgi:hypothetical protein